MPTMLSPFAQEPGHLTLLDDVDAEAVGGTGVTPSHSVVTGGAGAGLEDGALYGKAGPVRVVKVRKAAANLVAAEEFGVDPVRAHNVGAAAMRVEASG